MQIENFEELLNSRIIAYEVGMSVLDIQRAVRMNRIEYIHGLLRETGHIQPMSRSDFRKTYNIDYRRMSNRVRRMRRSAGISRGYISSCLAATRPRINSKQNSLLPIQP